MKNILLILISFCAITSAEAQWVVTVAGVLETPGFDDGPALSSRFFNPHGIAVDSSGVVYIADRFNHTIRRYDPVENQVKTIAGKAGETGDADGTGSEARFHEPWGICVTPGGTVYVSDTKNNKIRKVSPTGEVTTVAGSGNYGTSNGPALASTFGNPVGIEVDGDGNIYVADHNTHIIRKIGNDGTVSTLAGFPFIPGSADGTGSEAQFWRPYGLTLDHQGNILVADEWNHKIRRVTPDGVVTTVAGMGEPGLTNGAADEARFHFPWDVTVDDMGNIYVADGYNYVIRRIGTDGTVSSFAGKPQTIGGQDGVGEDASFSGATSVAWSARDSAVYVGDAYNNLVRSIFLYGLPTPMVSLNIKTGGTQLCEGDDVAFEVFPDFYSEYKFYLGGQLVQAGDATEFSMSNLEPGEYSLNVIALADTEVITSNTIIITVTAAPEPSISAIGPLDFFEGDSVILIANGTGDFLWSNGAGEQATTITESGTYFVEETVGTCTGISENVFVNVIPLPDGVAISVDGENVICPGGSVRLNSSSPIGNQWLKDGWPISGAASPFLEVSENGFYQVQVTDLISNITVISEGVEITTVPVPNFDFEAMPRQAFPGEEIRFLSSGNEAPEAYSWNFGEAENTDNTSDLPSPTHIYMEEGEYSIQLLATDGFGCEHALFKENYVQISETGTPVDGLFVPSAFTPNGDGVNDVFRARGPVTGDFYMGVFNQWGEAVFVSENLALGWDGTYQGEAAQTGTYTYLVTADTPDGREQLSGYITLFR